MIKKNVVNYKGQILERETFKLAAVHAVAEMIFTGLGDDYEDNRINAMKKYKAASNKKIFNVDTNKDGRLDRVESRCKSGNFSR